MMKEIILIGGGGHCKSCIEVIESTGKYNIIGILDLPEKKGKEISGYNVIGTDTDIQTFINKKINLLITLGSIGYPSRRIELFKLIQILEGQLPVICASTSYISKYAKIGIGTIIMHHAFINTNAVIGSNCIINTNALIEHDVYIGDHCHISTGSIVNGGTSIGLGSFFGSGAVSKHNIQIPECSFIKANSIVK